MNELNHTHSWRKSIYFLTGQKLSVAQREGQTPSNASSLDVQPSEPAEAVPDGSAHCPEWELQAG